MTAIDLVVWAVMLWSVWWGVLVSADLWRTRRPVVQDSAGRWRAAPRWPR